MSLNFIQNGTFAFNNLSDWDITGNVIASNGYAQFNSSDSTPNGIISQSITTEIGKTYRLEFNYFRNGNDTNQQFSVQIDGAGGTGSLLNTTILDPPVSTAPATYVVEFVADSTTTTLRFLDDPSNNTTASDFSLDNVSLVEVNTSLGWDFENLTGANGIFSSTPNTLLGDISNVIASQTGGGSDNTVGGSRTLLTRQFGTNYPFVEFTTTQNLSIQGLKFKHLHNHNSGFPTYPSYEVQLQIDSGSGFVNIGSPLTLNSSNSGSTDFISFDQTLTPGTYKIRWIPQGLNGIDTGTEFFAIDDLVLAINNLNQAPVINDQSFNVDENTVVGTVVGAVIATDADGDVLTYSIDSGNLDIDGDGNAAFAINSTTGEITVNDTDDLDFENTSTFNLGVGVTDGELSDAANVTINLNDVSEVNQVLSLDGVDDHVKVESVTFGSEYTLELFFKTDSQGEQIDLLSLDRASGSPGTYGLLELQSDGRLRFLHRVPAGGGGGTNIYSSESYNDGNWHHVAAVKSETGLVLYADGIEVGSVANTLSINDQVDIGIGILLPNNVRFFEGRLDDIRIWNTTRTQEEINNNLSQALNGNEAGLVGYYSFDQTSGTIISDLSGNGNDGTFFNGATIVPEPFPQLNQAPIVNDQSFNVDENSDSGTVVGTVVATDADGDVLTYSIDSGNTDVDGDGNVAFAIDSNTGEITVNDGGDLDFENTSTFNLGVGVTDGELSDAANVTINLNDVSEVNQVLSLDGVNDNVNVPSITFGSEYTIETFFKTSSPGTLLNWDNSSQTGDYGALILQADGTLRFVHRVPAGGSGGTNIYSTESYHDGNWHHLAAVKTATEIILYVDGIEVSRANNSNPINDQINLAIGFLAPTGGQYVNGNMEDVRIWNIARTAQEIADNLEQPLTGNEAGLVAYYTFDGADGTTINYFYD